MTIAVIEEPEEKERDRHVVRYRHIFVVLSNSKSSDKMCHLGFGIGTLSSEIGTLSFVIVALGYEVAT